MLASMVSWIRFMIVAGFEKRDSDSTVQSAPNCTEGMPDSDFLDDVIVFDRKKEYIFIVQGKVSPA